MTTDITELAQRMKTAAEKLDADQWQTRKGFSGIEVIVKGSLERDMAVCLSSLLLPTWLTQKQQERLRCLVLPTSSRW